MNKRKILITMFICCLIISIHTTIFAGNFSIGEIFTGANNFIDRGTKEAQINESDIAGIINQISGALVGIGSIVLLGVGMFLGIKYATSEPDAKADVKGRLIGLAVSAFVIYGAWGIWKLVYDIVSKL